MVDLAAAWNGNDLEVQSGSFGAEGTGGAGDEPEGQRDENVLFCF